MKSQLSEFTAIIGIGWADTKHDICVQQSDSDTREFSKILHKVDKIHEWAQAMYQRYGGPVAVAVELDKGPIVSALQKYNFFVIYPINPTTLAKYREAFNPSGAKDDPTDAELALDILISHPEHFAPLNPQSVEMRTLMTLVEQRRKLMNDRIRITNRLRNTLKQYYPQVLTLINQLEGALKSLRIYHKEITELASQHPDFKLFNSLPGAGPLLAPRLLVAFGEQRDRFTSSAEVQKYSGIAPVTERSGNKSWVHWRWQCLTFLRQTFVEWAAQTINKSYWAGLFYQQQRAKGCTRQATLRALAFKWIRILYRCWKTQTPYDEAKYLKVLKDRGSPLLQAANA